MKPINYIALSIFLCFFSSQFSLAQDAEHILEANKPALVSIWTLEDACFNEIKDSYSFDTLIFWGCGFIINADGLVGTCYHVISQIDTILIKLADGLLFPSTVAAVDTANDLALLKIQYSEDRKFPFVTLGNSDDLKTGETICVIGNPMGYEYSISQGIISGIRDSAKEYLSDKEIKFERVIQTDAAVSPGNSGGAFFNLKGEVIGITSYHYISLGNLNFGVAINSFRKLVERNRTELMILPVKSKADKEEKIEYFLEIANFLKSKIREYELMNDSLGQDLHARPSSLPGDTIKQAVNQDSLENVYLAKAEAFYFKCLKLDSSYFNTYDDLIDYYIKTRKPEKAEEMYRNAQQIFPDDERLKYLSEALETYYLRYKKLDKIKDLYSITVGNKDVGAEELYKLGAMYERIGDCSSAMKQYRLAINKDPKFYRASFQLGKHYYKLGYYSSAKKYFESAYENMQRPGSRHTDDKRGSRGDTYSDFELYYYLGMISIREGNKWAALINYMKLDPVDSEEIKMSLTLYKKIVK